MKKVTAVLLVYAILVIASSIFWVRYAVSKSRLIVRGNTGNIRLVAETDKMKKNVQTTTNNATELTGGVTEDVTADGQARRHREVK